MVKVQTARINTRERQLDETYLIEVATKVSGYAAAVKMTYVESESLKSAALTRILGVAYSSKFISPNVPRREEMACVEV